MTEMDISLNKLTRKLGQLLSFKTARLSVARCEEAKERGKTQSNFNEPQFPTSEEEAIAKSKHILKEMEYRSVRAARMCYEHSADFEKKHLYSTIGVTFASACLSLPITKILIDSVTKKIGNGWSMFSTVSVAAVIAILTYFKLAPEYILPLYTKKQLKYNKAGAGWQELELNIRSYRATQLRDKIVLEELRNELGKFAETRKQICLIARPTVEKHEHFENEELGKKMKENRKLLRNAVNNYFQTDEGDENTE